MDTFNVLAKNFLLIDEIFRFFAPFLLFVNPYLAAVLNIIFDFIDYPLFYYSGINWETSHRIDKLMDYWWYIFILIYVFVSQSPIFIIILILFSWRTIGQALTIFLKNERLLLLFPNVMEWYFDLFLLLTALGVGQIYLNLSNKLFLLIPCFLFGEFIEWIIHYSKPYAKFYKKMAGIKV